MKINKTVLLIMIFLLGAGVFSWVIIQKRSPQGTTQGQKAAKYYCPMHPHYTSDKPGDCPICDMRLVPLGFEENVEASAPKPSQAKVLFYRHPMRPELTSPVPSKDEMGMDYVPVYQEEGAPADPKTICIVHHCPMLKKGEICPMLVVAEEGEELECPFCKEKIKGSTAHPAASLEGYVPVFISPRKQQLIGIKTALVERKPVEKLIRTVGKIAYDPELYQAQAEYIQSLKSLKGLEAQGAGDTEWAKKLLESARTKLTLLGVNAPLIEEIGQSDAPDKSLLYAVPGGNAWVYANIYEYEIPLVKVGDILEVETSTAPGEKWMAQIRSMDAVVDPATRTVRVRATLKNQGLLKPELFVNASLKVDLGVALVVPEEAVFSSGKDTLVFVDKGEGLFDPRRVVLGPKAEGVYLVKEGLKEGERVVSNGNFLVDSESRLKAALSTMTAHAHGESKT